MPVLEASGRFSSAARSDRGAATTWPVQFMISAVSRPPGAPSAKYRRIDLPSLTGKHTNADLSARGWLPGTWNIRSVMRSQWCRRAPSRSARPACALPRPKASQRSRPRRASADSQGLPIVQRTLPRAARVVPGESILMSWASVRNLRYRTAAMVARGVWPRGTIRPCARARSVISCVDRGV